MHHPDEPHLTVPQSIAEEEYSPLLEDQTPVDPEPWPAEVPGRPEFADELSSSENVELDREPEPPHLEEKRASASTPSRAEPRDTFPAHLVIGICVFGLCLLVGAAFLWKARSDLGTLRSEVAVLKAQSQRAHVLQERASILRVRAELQSLRLTLPADLALEVDRADAALSGVDDRLKAAQ
jgi:hypothetical protein